MCKDGASSRCSWGEEVSALLGLMPRKPGNSQLPGRAQSRGTPPALTRLSCSSSCHRLGSGWWPTTTRQSMPPLRRARHSEKVTYEAGVDHSPARTSKREGPAGLSRASCWTRYFTVFSTPVRLRPSLPFICSPRSPRKGPLACLPAVHVPRRGPRSCAGRRSRGPPRRLPRTAARAVSSEGPPLRTGPGGAPEGEAPSPGQLCRWRLGTGVDRP